MRSLGPRRADKRFHKAGFPSGAIRALPQALVPTWPRFHVRTCLGAQSVTVSPCAESSTEDPSFRCTQVPR